MTVFPETPGQHKLVGQMRAHDPAAWHQFWDHYWGMVLQTVGMLLGAKGNNQLLVEELASNVMVALSANNCRRLAAYDPARGSLATFLKILAHQEVCRWHRSQRQGHAQAVPFSCCGLPEAAVSDYPEPMWLADYLTTLTLPEQDYVRQRLGARSKSALAERLSPRSRRRLARSAREKLEIWEAQRAPFAPCRQ